MFWEVTLQGQGSGMGLRERASECEHGAGRQVFRASNPERDRKPD